MSVSKTLLGQAWLTTSDNATKISLVQEQTLILDNGNLANNVVVLIDDVYDNLMNGSEEYPVKTNATKKYFFWEVKVTDTADDSREVTIRVECPKPLSNTFEEPYVYDENIHKTEWAKFWVERLAVMSSNLDKTYIQKQEYTLPTSDRVSFNPNDWDDPQGPESWIPADEIKVIVNDIGDVTNLLNAIF